MLVGSFIVVEFLLNSRNCQLVNLMTKFTEMMKELKKSLTISHCLEICVFSVMVGIV